MGPFAKPEGTHDVRPCLVVVETVRSQGDGVCTRSRQISRNSGYVPAFFQHLFGFIAGATTGRSALCYFVGSCDPVSSCRQAEQRLRPSADTSEFLPPPVFVRILLLLHPFTMPRLPHEALPPPPRCTGNLKETKPCILPDCDGKQAIQRMQSWFASVWIAEDAVICEVSARSALSPTGRHGVVAPSPVVKPSDTSSAREGKGRQCYERSTPRRGCAATCLQLVLQWHRIINA